MRDAVDEAISAGALEQESPGERADRERWERAISRKESALRVLGPLGFEDNNDGEAPGAIYHSGSGVVLDAENLKPQDVVHELLRIGRERGVEALRRDLRAAIGI
jgi:hypothetical protein